MRRARLLVASLVVAVVAAGVAFLLTWDIPPPSQQVEKVIPDERFPRQ